MAGGTRDMPVVISATKPPEGEGTTDYQPRWRAVIYMYVGESGERGVAVVGHGRVDGSIPAPTHPGPGSCWKADPPSALHVFVRTYYQGHLPPATYRHAVLRFPPPFWKPGRPHAGFSRSIRCHHRAVLRFGEPMTDSRTKAPPPAYQPTTPPAFVCGGLVIYPPRQLVNSW